MQLQACTRGSKKWWKMNAILLNRQPKSSSIPPMRTDEGDWLFDPVHKANLFATTWEMKNSLPIATRAEPTWFPAEGELLERACLRERWTLKFLRSVDVSKATGPDGLPARILREIAFVIFMQLTVLCRRILKEGHWPKIWRMHNICPLYKRKNKFDALNYRGIHITSILSKIAERVIGVPLLQSFEHLNSFGDHQWAYRKKRSSKDLIAVLMCAWIFAICSDMVVGGFLSDICGAFDHVFRPYFRRS